MVKQLVIMVLNRSQLVMHLLLLQLLLQALQQVWFKIFVMMVLRDFISVTSLEHLIKIDGIIGPDDYKAAIITRKVLRARVKRASKGFDGTTNIFDLTITNGTDYFPDSAGHMMIFINGILQPPGSNKAYTAYSNKIEFNEPPETGATFTGFYVGKMRQLG